MTTFALPPGEAVYPQTRALAERRGLRGAGQRLAPALAPGGTRGHAAPDQRSQYTAQDRDHVAELATQVQALTRQSVEVAFVDQSYTGEQPLEAAAAQGIRLEGVKLPAAKRGFVLLPRRWVVERRFAWTARFRRLARDYGRVPQTLAGLHFLAFALLRPHRFIHLVVHGL